MSKKSNNKKLLIILALLVGIFLITNYLRNNRSTNSVDTELIRIDTNAVSSISIYPTVGNKEKVIFTKQANNWNVKSDEISSQVKTGAIHQILTELSKIKINRLVAKTEDKWGKYQLTDSLSTRLQIKEKDKEFNIYLGKTKYVQPTRRYNQYGGNSFSGTTYIRLSDRPEIYEIDGFLTTTFNQEFNAWRKNDFLKANKEDLTQIQFHHTNNNLNFIITKNDSIWFIENEMVNSNKIEQYLNLLTNQKINNFEDAYSPSDVPDCSLTINGNNMENIKLHCYLDSLTTNYYMESSLNPGVFLKSDSEGLFHQLFVPKAYFMR